jgi:hypothetical protein
MISRFTALLALGALAACANAIPDSNPNANRGVGFGTPQDFTAQRAARDAELERRRAPEANLDDQAIAQDTLNVLGVDSAQTTQTAQAPAPAPVGAPLAGTGMLAGVPTAADNPNISDEQNFDAVSSRQTIESDRDRLKRQSDAMQVATPQALPQRPGNSGPNIVAFALSTSNKVGQAVYTRSGRFNEARFRRTCAKYGSSAQAPAAFLAKGGPERDREGLDPDGDGFACRWDPTPFRNARG